MVKILGKYNSQKRVKVHLDVRKSKKLGRNIYNIIQNGISIGEGDNFKLVDCEMEINETMQYLVRMTGFKLPHAYISGFLRLDTNSQIGVVRLAYRPLRKQYFFTPHDGVKVDKANTIYFTDKGTFL